MKKIYLLPGMRVKKVEKRKLDDRRTKRYIAYERERKKDTYTCMICGTEIIETSVADPGSLFRILIFIHPGSQIQQQQKKRRGGGNLLSWSLIQIRNTIETKGEAKVRGKYRDTEKDREQRYRKLSEGSKEIKSKSLEEKKRKITGIKVTGYKI
jgi:hypothetical protein